MSQKTGILQEKSKSLNKIKLQRQHRSRKRWQKKLLSCAEQNKDYGGPFRVMLQENKSYESGTGKRQNPAAEVEHEKKVF